MGTEPASCERSQASREVGDQVWLAFVQGVEI
jgi:hypothetical protein